MAKLDDFLGKKKETAPVLDLSKTAAAVSTQEEFRRLLEKVPDFKMRSEKVPPETIKLRDKFKINILKNDKKAMNEEYAFMNPIPVEMRNLDLKDLASVSIDWRMLTTQRPKLKLEEDFFSRLVELARSENRSRAQEKRQFELEPMIRKSKNKAGIVETRVVSCPDCGEDFCDGKVCGLVGYEAFARVQPTISQKLPGPSTSTGAVPKRGGRSRSKTKKKKGKSKSPRKKSKSPRKKSSAKIQKSKSSTRSSGKNKNKSPRRAQSEPPSKVKAPASSAKAKSSKKKGRK